MADLFTHVWLILTWDSHHVLTYLPCSHSLYGTTGCSSSSLVLLTTKGHIATHCTGVHHHAIYWFSVLSEWTGWAASQEKINMWQTMLILACHKYQKVWETLCMKVLNTRVWFIFLCNVFWRLDACLWLKSWSWWKSPKNPDFEMTDIYHNERQTVIWCCSLFQRVLLMHVTKKQSLDSRSNTAEETFFILRFDGIVLSLGFRLND